VWKGADVQSMYHYLTKGSNSKQECITIKSNSNVVGQYQQKKKKKTFAAFDARTNLQ